MVDYLLNGLLNGFHTGINSIPQQPLICKNLLTARSQPQVTSELIETEVKKGYLLGPFSYIPFDNYRINPVGIVEGKYSKKKRLIVDMSAPHGNGSHPSINDLICKDDFSLHYVTIDHAINLIKRHGQNSLLCKTDITDAFKLIPIHRDLWPFHGIQWNEKFYFYTRLVFGSRSSPKIFDCLSQTICWIAENIYNISNILHLLDDFLTVDGPDREVADRTMASLKAIFRNLEIPIAPHKTVGPTTCIEYLGIILDTVNMEARLPTDKVTRISDILSSFATRRSCTKRQLLSLLGHLNFACRVIQPGRSFVSYLISLSTTVKELHHHVSITAECRSDIAMWKSFLTGWNGISLFLNDDISNAADMHLFTDATDLAFGGIYNNQWFQGTFEGIELGVNDKMSMAFCELYPIVVACIIWGGEWSRKRILFHCDNMATVEIINKGRSKIKLIMKLMRRLTFCAAIGNFTVHARHVPGVKNNIADSISRFQMIKFRRLAPLADELPRPCPIVQDVLME